MTVMKKHEKQGMFVYAQSKINATWVPKRLEISLGM